MIDVRSVLRLYLVADPVHCVGDLLEQTERALRGGVTIVQLRVKHLSDLETLNLANRMRSLCHQYDVPFLVTDRLDIALAAGADGVHLGVDDLPVQSARDIAGPHFLIGFSPETNTQLRDAGERGANYLGVGPVYSTSTKLDAGIALGTDGFAEKVALANLPVVGIGGIGPTNFAEVLAQGAAGIAVVSAILGAADAEAAARQLSRNSNRSSTRGSSAGSQ